MKADGRITSEVKDTLNRFNEAFSKRDLNQLLGMLAPDPDVTFFGTGSDEERVGLPAIREQFERDWSQSDSAYIEWGPLSVSNAGPIAWVAGDVMFKAKAQGKEMTFPGRVTAVMDKRDGDWLFDQCHFSVPMAAQKKGQSFPTP